MQSCVFENRKLFYKLHNVRFLPSVLLYLSLHRALIAEIHRRRNRKSVSFSLCISQVPDGLRYINLSCDRL